MARWVRILTLVAFLAPTTGVWAMLGPDSCAAECAGEAASAEPCDAPCTFCACCPGLRSILFTPIDVAAPDVPTAAVALPGIDTPQAPDPREILHVPITSAA